MIFRRQHFSFFFLCCSDHPYLHSFPTRRSSDLLVEFLVEREGGLRPRFAAIVLRQQLVGAAADVHERGGVHVLAGHARDRKSTRLNSSHTVISYAVFCLKKKTDLAVDNTQLLSM